LDIALSKPKAVSKRIEVKIGKIVLQVNSRRLTETVFDIWSYFQDGSHGVRPPLDVDVQDCPYEGEKHKVTK